MRNVMKRTYTVLIMENPARFIPCDKLENHAHSEIEVSSVYEAEVYLFALARKSRPEWAVANIDDHRIWTSNEGFESGNLDPDFAKDVEALIAKMEKADDAAEVCDNEYLPDITVTPINEGVARVKSSALQCEFLTKDVTNTIAELIRVYRDLIQAGEVSKPCY